MFGKVQHIAAAEIRQRAVVSEVTGQRVEAELRTALQTRRRRAAAEMRGIEHRRDGRGIKVGRCRADADGQR